ncbi:hypothetical protein AB6Q13_07640 [Ralstonia solanacearum]|uniref:hypothetical protein n=1 Tax=Ralstonia solanacearum TaxID=305 RepID=UPI0023057B83|nr:hypothetical protein [Ralstonia solanacearum]MDB0566919.1 hypothetical protein [Ralstonia solanacearum]MDB0576642.1 hypothetical protein [Ralstonia solanacearum]
MTQRRNTQAQAIERAANALIANATNAALIMKSPSVVTVMENVRAEVTEWPSSMSADSAAELAAELTEDKMSAALAEVMCDNLPELGRFTLAMLHDCLHSRFSLVPCETEDELSEVASRWGYGTEPLESIACQPE